MKLNIINLPTAAVILLLSNVFAAASNTVICNFEHMPKMILTFNGGMGANDNTIRIGKADSVKLSVGSSLMMATVGKQELVISLRLPNSVTISAPDNDTLTYFGECHPK